MDAIRAMLAGLIDYAGIFPPAKLSMAQAVRNYAKYREGAHAWLLGRFVIQAGRMEDFADEFAAFATGRSGPQPWALSVLGHGSDDAAGFAASLAGDVQSWLKLREHFPGRLDANSWEIRLPQDAVAACDNEALLDCAAAADTQLGATLDNPRVALEVPMVGDCAVTLPAAVSALAHAQRKAARIRLSAKIRTGGVEPWQVPGAAQVASFIAACAEEGLPFKATAGMHHPLRHVDATLGVPVFGFLNVFGAGALARAGLVHAETLQAVLDDHEASHFKFAGERFCWKDKCIAAADIVAAREQFALSFGSCSFDEPIADLKALGLA